MLRHKGFTRSLAVLALLATALGRNAPAATNDTVPGSFVPVEGGRLYYEECGKGSDTVILIHDGLVHSAAWDDVWPAFCKAFHTIRYDRRGYGRSPAATEWFSPVDDLAALMQQTKTRQAALVAASAGGGLALDFTLQHPEAVTELVLIGSVVGGFAVSEAFIKEIGKGVPYLVAHSYAAAPGNEALRKRLADIMQANPQDVAPHNFARPIYPALPLLSKIDVSTLIIVGDADHPDNHAAAGAIQAGIPRSRRVVFKDSGHLPYLEHPVEFSDLVIGFLQTNAIGHSSGGRVGTP
jgi:3-oxoadipate enol-lactonase